MRLVFILLLFATTAQAQFVINPYVFAQIAAGVVVNEKSIDLDGTSEYVRVPDDNSLSFGNGTTDEPFTISAWVFMHDATSFRIIQKDSSASFNEYRFVISSADKIYFALDDESSGGRIRVESAAITSYENQWIHLAATYDGSESQNGMTVFLNGVDVSATRTLTAPYTAMENTVSQVDIGRFYDGPTYADGKLDQVALWDTVLSIDEIKEMIAIRDYNYHSQADNLISWWEFDNDDTSVDGITDLIGTNNGTMQSGEAADLNPAIPFPYAYLLDSNAVWDSITPLQYGFTDSIHGGFGWSLDGSTEHIDIADSDDFSFGDGSNDSPMTISVWANMVDATSCHLFNKDSTGQREWFFLVGSTDKFALRLTDQSTGGYIQATTKEKVTNFEGDFAHFLSSYDGSGNAAGINLYINNELIDVDTTRSGTYVATENTSQRPEIGRLAINSTYAEATFGDVIIFNKELSAAEIADVYNLHSPRNESYESLSANIVGYWRPYNSTNITNGVIDQSGNGNNGNPVNTDDGDFVYDYSRKIADSSGSFKLDGTNEYLLVPDADNLSFTDGAGNDEPFSISWWWKGATVIGDGLIGKDAIGAQEWYIANSGSSNGQLELRLQTDSVNYINRVSSGGAIVDNLWNNFVISYDGSESGNGISIYRNGVLLNGTASSTGTYTGMGNTSADLWLGGIERLAYYADDWITNVTIVNRVLTNEEVIEIYNDGSIIDITKSTFASDIISHWYINAKDDPTVTVSDAIGANTATPQNMEAGDLKTSFEVLSNLYQQSHPTN